MSKKANANWIAQARVVKTRPVAAVAAASKGTVGEQLTALLKGTLKAGGAVRVAKKALPMRLKSLRTQVALIARPLKATSHVLEEDGVVTMWLEPRSAETAKRTARPNNGKRKRERVGRRPKPDQTLPETPEECPEPVEPMPVEAATEQVPVLT